MFLSRLYSHIDISCHNDLGLWPSIRPGTLVFPDNPQRLLEDETPGLRRRQERFLQTMSVNPSFATFVHSFIWTFIPWYENEGEELQADLTPTWRILASFGNVRKVDFISLAQVREDAPPSHLFSSVKFLRIGGQISHVMVTSIMSSFDPAALTSLGLDDLQDFGHVSRNKPMPLNTNLSVARETSDKNGLPILQHPGPMRGYLHLLKGKCTALKRLIMRTVGQELALDSSWSEEKDLERYKQWADFIDSVRFSLEGLEIEHGLEAEDPQAMPPCSRIPMAGIRPMDMRFIHAILPVLTRKPWPRLVSMSVRGIGGRRSVWLAGDDGPLTISQSEREDITLQIKAVIPATARLLVRHDAQRTYYHRFCGAAYGRT